MVTKNHHPWLLTGPWYRWKNPHDANVGREERPVFQKYETSDLVNEFLKNPQHSLKFVHPDDVVRRPEKKGRRYTFATTNIRKMYLDTHKRFYLVVCELHCDMPGFPNASREEVCEAGLVVRRRLARVPKAAESAARKMIQNIGVSRAQLAQLEELPPGMKSGATLGLRAELEAKYTVAQGELQATAKELGINLVLQGWIPNSFQGIGSWQEVTESPQQITEQIFPLYPLIPDPQIKNHSSGGRTIYFGLLPTGSPDVDAFGNSRFDDRSLYEVRCFVRRHNPKCPRRPGRNDCKGEVVWSRRTESYQLANPFDLSGTSNRPINIFLPDLPALEAQAASLKPGQGAPVRMIAPPSSNLEVTGELTTMKGVTPSGAICSFSIPLITIVASFVFRLFLPIVMFLFGLWFLLKLKFCIPPMLDLDADLALELDAAAGKIDAGVDVDVAISASLFARLQDVKEPSGIRLGDLKDQDKQPFGKKALADFAITQSADFSASVPTNMEVDSAKPGAIPLQLPSATAGLEYEARVEVKA